MTPKKRTPEIDPATCVCCQGCVELAPDVFHYNPAGYMEVLLLDAYPEDRVEEARVKCPKDSISWTETD